VTLVVELRGVELFGYHGVLDDERRSGQRFLVDLELEPSDATAAASDRIEDAVDYRDVVAVVQSVSDRTAYRLLEAFAAAIADELLQQLPLRRVAVRVRKPDVVLGAPVEHAAVRLERTRNSRLGGDPRSSTAAAPVTPEGEP
jgi:dihydroneopterin aldolase